MEQEKQYEGSVYIGVVGSETENGECRDSIDLLSVRPGDEGPSIYRGTKGYEVRQMHFNKWYNETDHAFLFLMDADQIFPKDALEKLRSHKMPFISGFYMRRTYAPAMPVWFLPPEKENGQLYRPWTGVIEPNKLYELGASGWGCMLIHRDVATAVRDLLKGEGDILEDDMDLWPYDLSRIMTALNIIDSLSAKEGVPASALRDYVDVLKSEIRPLRGSKDIVGSDVRYPFFARMAGYPLYGDSGVDCGHMLNYPVTGKEWMFTPQSVVNGLEHANNVLMRNEQVKLDTNLTKLDVAKP